MCWNWLLGTCRFGANCHFVRSHDNGRQLPDRVVEKVIRVLKLGVEKMLGRDQDESGAGSEARVLWTKWP
jgi:hypothetical protein